MVYFFQFLEFLSVLSVSDSEKVRYCCGQGLVG
jgi:hypothetical protein